MLSRGIENPILLAQEGSSLEAISPVAILWFGGVALVLLTLTQIARIYKGGQFSQSFTRLFGILTITTLGTVLVFADVAEETRAAAYTLFGTAAGYFAARPSTTKDE